VLLAACGGDREAEPGTPQPSGPPLFREVAADLGVDFVHEVTSDGRYRIAEIIGPGVAAFDADGDGRLDLLFASAGDGIGRGAANRLYLQGDDGRFRDATAETGIGGSGFTTGLAVGDVDNDGDQDVYVGNWGEDGLWINDGSGRFERHAADVGLGGPADGLTASVAFVDVDLDGHLDVFVTRYVLTIDIVNPDGTPISEYSAPDAYPPAPDSLYRNRGDGTFEEITEPAGLAVPPGPGLAVTVEDLDADGIPDVYVGNDGLANHAWLSAGDGTLREEAIRMGLAYNGMGTAEASMGIAIGDVDGDGHRDLVLAHLIGETNTLYRRMGSAGFDDASGRSGVAGVSVPYTGWGIALLDVELDGDLDLAIANGAIARDHRQYGKPGPTPWELYEQPYQLLLNDGSGQLVDAPSAFGGLRSVGRGLIAVDLDDDGDLDVVTTQIAGAARIFENVAEHEGHWLRVRCVDPALRRDVIGASVELTCGERRFSGIVSPATSYASSRGASMHFGLGSATQVDAALVTWPGGEVEHFRIEGVDRAVVLERGKGTR
jgi:hypothetical protein